jgi:hypothetical protein
MARTSSADATLSAANATETVLAYWRGSPFRRTVIPLAMSVSLLAGCSAGSAKPTPTQASRSGSPGNPCTLVSGSQLTQATGVAWGPGTQTANATIATCNFAPQGNRTLGIQVATEETHLGFQHLIALAQAQGQVHADAGVGDEAFWTSAQSGSGNQTITLVVRAGQYGLAVRLGGGSLAQTEQVAREFVAALGA